MLAAESTLENTPQAAPGRALVATTARLVDRLRSAGLDLLFPPACAGCGADLDGERYPERFCGDCLPRLKLFHSATCMRCGAGVPGSIARQKCILCGGIKLRFDEAVAVGQYDGLLRDWLLVMKDDYGDKLALAVADLIWARCGERLEAMRPDVVVPVPIHWRRRFVRGTNSAAVLAERLAERLHKPLAAHLLRRTRHTPPQFSLPPSARAANVRGAFAVRAGHHLHATRVLLVDDILTTCSTANAVSRTLKKAGAAYVAVAVAARTMSH